MEILGVGEAGRRGRRRVRWLLLHRRRASGGIQQRNGIVGLGIVGHLEGEWTTMLCLAGEWIGRALVGEGGSEE